VLAQAVEVVRVEPCVDFPAARAKLFTTSFDFLVSNLRLGAYNGLHLVHLVLSEPGLPTRYLVYGDGAQWLAREAQRLGAFYEFPVRLPHALPAYLQALLDARLPALDRRDPGVPDRRGAFRGGRRRADVPLSAAAPLRSE
jgi:hypothetical protein